VDEREREFLSVSATLGRNHEWPSLPQSSVALNTGSIHLPTGEERELV